MVVLGAGGPGCDHVPLGWHSLWEEDWDGLAAIQYVCRFVKSALSAAMCWDWLALGTQLLNPSGLKVGRALKSSPQSCKGKWLMEWAYQKVLYYILLFIISKHLLTSQARLYSLNISKRVWTTIRQISMPTNQCQFIIIRSWRRYLQTMIEWYKNY